MSLLSGASLQRKLRAVVLLTTLIALVTALGGMVAYDLRSYHGEWVNDIQAQAELLGRTSAPALSFDDPVTARGNLEHLRFQPRIQAAGIYSAQGSVFASYRAHPGAPPLPDRPGAEGVRVEGDRLIACRRVVENGELLGTVYLRADYPLVDRLQGYSGIALGVVAIAMLVAFAVSSWLQRIVTQPILGIATIAGEVVERGDYSRRAPKISDDEVGRLALAFNDMLAEIERRTRELEDSNRDKAREVEERKQAQQEVMRLNAELERRVQERTAQLEVSNQELVAATAAAEQANRAKSEFLSSMSHELRTPLNAIIGFGQLLSTGLAPVSPEQQKVYTEQIVRAGRHLLSLINEVLDLAHIESGRLAVSMESVVLADVLEECRAMVDPMGAHRGVRLLFPEHCGLTVRADHTRLKQVLLNLLSNAVKYNREGGAVVVDCSATPEGRARIAVQDTGLGLSPDQRRQLFQPFNRLGQESGPQEGTGIGLVVTKRLVELMEGSIGVSSQPGSGSTFWIELQLAAPAAAIDPEDRHRIEASGPDKAAPAGATVLYVEDNPASLALMKEILSLRPDVRLLTAHDGRLGVDMARAHLPDVVLMDLNLPGLDGHEARALLQSDSRTAHIPVIALTANAMPRAVAQGLASGFFRYLTKPIDIPVFLDVLNEALASGRQSSRARDAVG